MIGLDTIPVNLKVNSNESIVLDKYFMQGDNKTAKFKFRIYLDNGSEINYAEIKRCVLTMVYSDSTYLPPIDCSIIEDGLEKMIHCNMLSKEGITTCRLRIYGDDDVVFTSSLFRFVIIKNIDADKEISSERVSVLDSIISEINHLNESITVNENIRASNELSRVENENIRIENESSRVSDFENIKLEFDTIKQQNQSMKCALNMVVNIESLSNGSFEKTLIVIPSSLSELNNYNIKNILLLSHGDSFGIDDENTVELLITEGEDVLLHTVYDSQNKFPSTGEFKEYVISDGLIDKDIKVNMSTIHGTNAITPEFSLQINYEVV